MPASVNALIGIAMFFVFVSIPCCLCCALGVFFSQTQRKFDYYDQRLKRLEGGLPRESEPAPNAEQKEKTQQELSAIRKEFSSKRR